jgi:hypothetical protein
MTEIAGPVIRCALLVVYLVGAALRGRRPPLDRHWARFLGALVAVALLAYLGFVRVHEPVGRLHVHHWDVYHYYLGTKYFAELGQDGLYEATVIADWEDDRAGFQPGSVIRDLRGGVEPVPRARVLERRDEIRSRFASAARWAQFKADVAWFRAADPERWRRSEIQMDHGYNGTPLTTALLGALARWSPGGVSRFLQTVVWADLLLVLALGAWVARRLGRETGLSLLFFWFANPLNDYDFIGGGFLRYDYFLALALGSVLLVERRAAASGVWLALAALFRVFPVLFPLALAGADAIHPQRRRRLREHAPLYAAGLATALLCVVATSWIATPDGRNPWLAQLERVATRSSHFAPNALSLQVPFFYDHAHNVSVAIEAARRGEDFDWLAQTTATFERRRPAYLAALAALALPCLVFARRARPGEALFLGVVALFGAFAVAHYYFCVLSLLPVFFRGDRAVPTLLAAGLLSVTALPALAGGVQDLGYLLRSLGVLALLLAVLALRLRAPRAPAASS